MENICFPNDMDDSTYTLFIQSEPTLLYRVCESFAGSFTCTEMRVTALVMTSAWASRSILELTLLCRRDRCAPLTFLHTGTSATELQHLLILEPACVNCQLPESAADFRQCPFRISQVLLLNGSSGQSDPAQLSLPSAPP